MEGDSSPGSQRGPLLTVVSFQIDAKQMRTWGKRPAHQRVQDEVVREEMVSWCSEEATSLLVALILNSPSDLGQDLN